MSVLATLRGEGWRHWLAMAVAAAVGLAVASVHWAGFVLGGALVGLLAPTPKRGVMAGFAFGVLAWLAFLLVLGWQGALGGYPAMGQVFAVSTAIPVVGGTLGGLVRALG